MKFVIDTPERLRLKMQSFPEYFRKGFSSTRKLLILCVSDNDEAIGACGIGNLSNYLLIYVDKEWRGQGIGTRILRKTIDISRGRGFDFIALAVRPNNTPALRLYDRFSFREVANLEEFGFMLMIVPFSLKGELIYGISRAICWVLPKSILVHAVTCGRLTAISIRNLLRY